MGFPDTQLQLLFERYEVCWYVTHLLRSFQGTAFFIPGPAVLSLLQRIQRKAATDIYEFMQWTLM